MDADRVDKEIDGLFDELLTLFKTAEVETALTERGVNASLAMLIADGLRAYLKGDKAAAADDLGTAAEEITHRLETGRAAKVEEAKRKPS